ncbi:CDP-diacylglycerol--glycerol-3-phosphate 3-phosphatidyltransferase [Paenibacillus alkalitolerans]|uniref:CDP-diacylglycerol--glycerol-3-phosphate 3-phosphatidyltransferase n=1 Tax=Paenibacillus alkalitolerans TaxID=2799335 RepID=UPI0018F2D649|nr:CDP-diacylglycerol--glycerol-3-phosphate 3-phosphatidyltransferase [Paenibacillus alkalitolerans]
MNLANKITVARILLIPLLILLFPTNPYYAAAVFLLASATDKLDGYIARKYNQITNLGKLLDPLADKLLISTALILMVSQQWLPAWIAMVIISREIIITAIRLVASSRKIALQADRYGKIKMAFQVAAVAAMLLSNGHSNITSGVQIDQILMYIALIITVYSGYNYIRNNYRSLKLV